MDNFEVITGFGYFTENSTGHIISKLAGINPGFYPMSDGYTYTEVADQTALDAIQVWQAPPPPPVPVGDINYDELPIIPDASGQQVFFENATGAALFVSGWFSIDAINLLEGEMANGTLDVCISNIAPSETDGVKYFDVEPVRLSYASVMFGYEAKQNLEFPYQPISFVVPKGKFFSVGLSRGYKAKFCGPAGGSLADSVKLFKTNLFV